MKKMIFNTISSILNNLLFFRRRPMAISDYTGIQQPNYWTYAEPGTLAEQGFAMPQFVTTTNADRTMWVEPETAAAGLQVDETQMKRLIKEAMRELRDEDPSFAGFLHRKHGYGQK